MTSKLVQSTKRRVSSKKKNGEKQTSKRSVNKNKRWYKLKQTRSAGRKNYQNLFEKVFPMVEDDIKLQLWAYVHIGHSKSTTSMRRYIYKKPSNHYIALILVLKYFLKKKMENSNIKIFVV